MPRVFDGAWFARHQLALLRAVNHPAVGAVVRWLLGLRPNDVCYRREILALYPHAYTVGHSDGSFTTDFRSGPVFARRLRQIGLPIWYGLHLWDRLTWWQPAWDCGFNTLTVSPDAAPETTTVDGTVQRRPVPGESFATIRAAAGTFADDTNFVDIVLRSTDTTDQYDKLGRAIFLFNTSPLTALATILAATVSLEGVTGATKNNTLGSPDLHIAGSTPASNTALVASDYGQCQTTSFGSITYASVVDGAYNNIALNTAGLAAINQTGITKFSAQLSWDLNNSFTGTWAASSTGLFDFYTADQGPSDAPKLVVTYSLSTGGWVRPATSWRYC